jgi:hypothetical protein
MGAGAGYQLPKIGGYSGGGGKTTSILMNNAKLQRYSPAGQRAQFQQEASKQAADPNSDPMQNFYNSQQLHDMTQQEQAADEAQKAAMQKRWGQAYGLDQGGQAQAGGSKYIAQGAQKRYGQRNSYGQ